MPAVGCNFFERLTATLVQIAVTALAAGIFAAPAAATNLDGLYETLMTIRGCEMEVSEEDWENLTVQIEQTVSSTGASSDAVNGIFDSIKSEMSVDLEAYCSSHADDVAAVLDNLN